MLGSPRADQAPPSCLRPVRQCPHHARRKSGSAHQGPTRRPRKKPSCPARPSHLFATRMLGWPALRTTRAKHIVGGRHTIPCVDHKQNKAGLRYCLFALLSHARLDRSGCSPLQDPAVSISTTLWEPSSASPSRRSRVRPGRSETSAVDRPVRRLNRVDLPTFGRPTIAIVGAGNLISQFIGKRSHACLSHGSWYPHNSPLRKLDFKYPQTITAR